jgi:hypothetical protein
MTTDKTIRTETQWLKITRDNKAKTFTFARGYSGNYQAHEIETLTFKWVANWKEAVERAESKLATFA